MRVEVLADQEDFQEVAVEEAGEMSIEQAETDFTGDSKKDL